MSPPPTDHPWQALDVVVVGLNVVDILVRLPAQVHPGEKHEVRDLVIQGGAPAANAACGLAMLGWRTGMFARMGSDSLSALARADFARYGVRPDLFIDDPASRPAAAVVSIDHATGDRTVFYTLDGYGRLRPEDVPADRIREARLVLVDGYEVETARAALIAARKANVPSVLDVEAGEPDALRDLISHGTDCILPLGGAQNLTGERDPVAALRKLAQGTDAQLVITDGVRGSWALTPQGILHQPAFEVAAVDTTGCGDSFHAAYASALLDGLPLPQRLEFAAWVAAEVALKLGGRSNLPTRQSLPLNDPSPLSPPLRQALLESEHARTVTT